MRKLLLGIALTIGLAASAAAQTCLPVDSEFVAAGVKSLQSGETKGQMLDAAKAAAFGDEAGIPDMLAVFLIEGDTFIYVVQPAPGVAVACMGAATPEGLALFRKHQDGQGV